MKPSTLKSLLAAAPLCLFICLGVGGCDTVKAPYDGRSDQIAPGSYPQISAEKAIEKVMVFDEPVVVAGDGQRPMSVQVGVRNTHKKPINVQYRFEFFDESGRPLSQTDAWRYEQMPSRTQQFWLSNALDNRAVSYRLIVRLAK